MPAHWYFSNALLKVEISIDLCSEFTLFIVGAKRVSGVAGVRRTECALPRRTSSLHDQGRDQRDAGRAQLQAGLLSVTGDVFRAAVQHPASQGSHCHCRTASLL
jgi:hypothetical protein